MRLILFFLVLFGCFHGNAQGVISLPEYSILYKAYDNVVTFGAGKKTRAMVLESDELSISQLNDSMYIVRVSTTSRTAQITARNKWTNKIVKTWNVRIMNLPSAVIYWGNYPPGSEISLDQKALRADYGENQFWANSEIEIQTYEINSDLFETSIRVTGGSITPEVIEALKKAKAENQGQPIRIELAAQVKGKDHILRKASATFSY